MYPALGAIGANPAPALLALIQLGHSAHIKKCDGSRFRFGTVQDRRGASGGVDHGSATIGYPLVHPRDLAIGVADPAPFAGLGDDLKRQTAGAVDEQQLVIVARPGAGVHLGELERDISRHVVAGRRLAPGGLGECRGAQPKQSDDGEENAA